MHTYHLTQVSGNAKTGPIPVSTTSASTCPTACPLKKNGCYAEHGPVGLHWRAVSAGTRGVDLDTFCSQLQALPKHQLWRWAQAGDLPGDGECIDTKALAKIVKANTGKKGFGFTHYAPSVKANATALRKANDAGFTLNLSANDLAHADQLAETDAGPVVTLLPADQRKPMRTPAGRLVAICPAYTTEGMTCARCGICAVSTRKAIVGFPAHGSAVRKATKVFYLRSEPL